MRNAVMCLARNLPLYGFTFLLHAGISNPPPWNFTVFIVIKFFALACAINLAESAVKSAWVLLLHGMFVV